ncbi:MAG: glycosyltransferase [Candidatus Hydrogenedens sp.]|nr:glycosyltransferase [Candidatus Hydrogenedens sp.]
MKAVIVIPVYNESATLSPLTEQIIEHMPLAPYRILFVDDGSTDDSFRVIRGLHDRFPEVNYLRFTRNAGKTQALASAFARTDADVIVTMDADLQDDPAELPKLLGALGDDGGVVCGWKQNRRDPLHKTFPSKVFNKAMAGMFGLPLHDINTGFKAMRGDAARAITLTGDRHRFIPVLIARLGYRAAEVPVLHHPREFGHSKYGFERYFQGIRDAFALWRESRGWRKEPPYHGEPEGLVGETLIDRG